MVIIVLFAYPENFEILRLAAEIDKENAIKRAVRDLVEISLLERRGISISLSAAVLCLEELELP